MTEEQQQPLFGRALCRRSAVLPERQAVFEYAVNALPAAFHIRWRICLQGRQGFFQCRQVLPVQGLA